MTFSVRLISLFCICFLDNLRISGAIQCYICQKCNWTDLRIEECTHACQSVSNPDGTFTKRCSPSTDFLAPLKCQYNKNCTCTSDLCNGINFEPEVTRGQIVDSPENKSFQLKSSSRIIQDGQGERTNVVLNHELKINSAGRIKRAIKRVYYKSAQVTKTTGSLVTSEQTHKELNTVSTGNTGNAARHSLVTSSSSSSSSPSSQQTKRSSLTTHLVRETPLERKVTAQSTRHNKEINGNRMANDKLTTESTFEDASAYEDSGFTIEEFPKIGTTKRERSSESTDKRFYSSRKITSNSVIMSNGATSRGTSNSEQRTSVYDTGEVTSSPNTQHQGISTDEENSGMETKDFPFLLSSLSPSIGSENETSSGEKFTKGYENPDDDESSTPQANLPNSTRVSSGSTTSNNHYTRVTNVHSSEHPATNEKNSISWSRDDQTVPEPTNVPTLQPNKKMFSSPSSTPYAANESHKTPAIDDLFSLATAAELSEKEDNGRPEYPDNELSNEQEMGHIFTIWVVVGSLCLLVILIGLFIMFVKIVRKNKTYVIN